MNSLKSLFKTKIVLLLGSISLLTFSGCKKDLQSTSVQEESVASANAANQAEGQPATDYMPNELLVKFIKGSSATVR